jgi:hypothetical protein
MQKETLLQLSPKEAADAVAISERIALHWGLDKKKITGFEVLKRSIDARKRNVLINLKVKAFIDEPFHDTPLTNI